MERDVRSATVTATTDTLTFEISADELDDLLERYPRAALAMLRMLSRRLRNTDILADQFRA